MQKELTRIPLPANYRVTEDKETGELVIMGDDGEKSLVEEWVRQRKGESNYELDGYAEAEQAFMAIEKALPNLHGRLQGFFDGYSYLLFLQSRNSPVGQPMRPEKAEEGKFYLCFHKRGSPFVAKYRQPDFLDTYGDCRCPDWIIPITPDFTPASVPDAPKADHADPPGEYMLLKFEDVPKEPDDNNYVVGEFLYPDGNKYYRVVGYHSESCEWRLAGINYSMEPPNRIAKLPPLLSSPADPSASEIYAILQPRTDMRGLPYNTTVAVFDEHNDIYAAFLSSMTARWYAPTKLGGEVKLEFTPKKWSPIVPFSALPSQSPNRNMDEAPWDEEVVLYFPNKTRRIGYRRHDGTHGKWLPLNHWNVPPFGQDPIAWASIPQLRRG